MEQEIQNLQYHIQLLSNKLDNIENQVVTQHNNINMMMQSMNMQIQLLNQMSQTISNFSNKMADMEINLNNSDDYVKDVLDSQNNLSIELNELKNAIEGIRFFAINQSGNYNPNF